jgi:hypothetical protein
MGHEQSFNRHLTGPCILHKRHRHSPPAKIQDRHNRQGNPHPNGCDQRLNLPKSCPCKASRDAPRPPKRPSILPWSWIWLQSRHYVHKDLVCREYSDIPLEMRYGPQPIQQPFLSPRSSPLSYRSWHTGKRDPSPWQVGFRQLQTLHRGQQRPPSQTRTKSQPKSPLGPSVILPRRQTWAGSSSANRQSPSHGVQRA